MVPIFPPWKKSPLSTLRVCRAPAARREARVAAVYGFAPRLRTCVRRSKKAHAAPTCGWVPEQCREFPAAAGKNPPVREEPASHLASRRHAGSLPNDSNRAEARAHFYERRKDEKRQTIQYSNFNTGFGNDTRESSTSPYEPERLCDRVLSRKTHRDS